jgi:hypothetical protein
MNPFSEIVGINCLDLNAVITWHKSKMEEFQKFEITDAQLMIYLRELNGGIVPNLGKNPSRSDIIKLSLDSAASGMSFYDEHYCWVAKQVIKHDVDRITMHVDTPTLNRFSNNVQSLFFAAANVPDSLSLEDKIAITVCPDPYLDVGKPLSNSLSKTEITIMEWIAIGKWLNYEIPTNYRFSECIWREHLGYLFTNYPIDIIVCDQSITIHKINNQHTNLIS